MESKYKFTIFTATYNRAYCLGKVFECLNKQTFRDFEWIIVDDGSFDNTEELVKGFISQAEIPIKYIKTTHMGKHNAHNVAVNCSEGLFFLPLDSDDTCIPETLDIFHNVWVSLFDHERDLLSGIGCHCMERGSKKIVGDMYPKDMMISNDLEMSLKYNVRGEKWGIIKTEILKEFLFPMDANVKFIKENVVWYQIARKYQKIFINKALRYYEVHTDSLSIVNKYKNLDGSIYSYLFLINEFGDYYLKYSRIRLIKMIGYAMILNKKLLGRYNISKNINSKYLKLVAVILIPAAMLGRKLQNDKTIKVPKWCFFLVRSLNKDKQKNNVLNL